MTKLSEPVDKKVLPDEQLLPMLISERNSIAIGIEQMKPRYARYIELNDHAGAQNLQTQADAMEQQLELLDQQIAEIEKSVKTKTVKSKRVK